MTVLSSELQMVGTSRATLPRVNLLPPEIAERRAFRRLQVALGAVGLGALAVVGLLYVTASRSVSAANDDLASAKTTTTQLEAEVSKYRYVTAMYAAAETAQAQLVVAMADEVRYSQMLNDLSLTIPSNVWITNLGFTKTASAGAAPAGAPGAAQLAPSVGSLAVSGVAFAHDDVAAWLDAIAGLKTYSNVYFSSSTKALIGTRSTVNFTSTADLTDKALSGRYTRQLGG